MSRGWNTEAAPSSLPQGAHPVFTNLTLRSGAATPRSADAAFAPTEASTTQWRLQQLGVNHVTELYDGDGREPRSVTIPLEGGTPLIHSANGEVTEELTFAAPSQPPNLDHPEATFVDGDGLAPEGSRSYAITWVSDMGHETALSPVTKVHNDYLRLDVTGLVGSMAAMGALITNTSTGATAIVREASPGASYYLIAVSDKSDPAGWTATQTLSWEGGSGALEFDEAPVAIMPAIIAQGTPPAQAAGYNLYRLDEDTGYWRAVNDPDALTPLGQTCSDDTYFPYRDADATLELPFYPGPLDENALPETLIESITGATAAAWHKGCLFVAEGETVLYSEPTRPRLMRSWARLNAGGQVLALKSRGGVIEVFTTTSVREIRGDAPYFEIWELGVHEGPVCARSIVATDLGTFVLFDDGIYLYAGGRIRSLTAGGHTPWVRGLDDPAQAVAGASHGVYYLVAPDGDCLAYDWEADEWFHRTFTTRPGGFHFVEEVRALVARVGDSYLALEQGDAPVEWAIEYTRGGDATLRQVPGRVLADAKGQMNLELVADGERVCRFPLTALPGSVRLPPARARSWALVLDGIGTKDDTVIRELRHD